MEKIEIEDLSLSVKQVFDYDVDVVHGYASIITLFDDEEIGHIKFERYFTMNDIVDDADALSQDSYDTVLEFVEHVGIDECVYVVHLDEIVLDKEYRGNNIVGSLFKKLYEILPCMTSYILQACPLDNPTNKEEATKKLIALYESWGFERYGNKDRNYLWINV